MSYICVVHVFAFCSSCGNNIGAFYFQWRRMHFVKFKKWDSEQGWFAPSTRNLLLQSAGPSNLTASELRPNCCYWIFFAICDILWCRWLKSSGVSFGCQNLVLTYLDTMTKQQKVKFKAPIGDG